MFENGEFVCMADLFRKISLEKLASTEQLDRMITVIKPKFWLVLLGSVVTITAGLVWSFYGSIPTCVDGTAILAPSYHAQTVFCYLPVELGKQVQQGMEVIISPLGENPQKDNRFAGQVVRVDSYVTDREEMYDQLNNETLVEHFLQNGPVVAIECQIEGLESKGFSAGTLMDCNIVLERKAPVSFLLPSIIKIGKNTSSEEGIF